MTDQGRLNLLFVCTGNTCRSPMAQVLAERSLAVAGWQASEVRSAGASAMFGSRASEGAIRASAEEGLDLQGHRSTPLSEELVEWADLILTMGAHHLVAVEALGGRGKTAMLSAFAEGRENEQAWGVPDPFAGDLDVYRDSFRVLAELIEAVVERLGRASDTTIGNDT